MSGATEFFELAADLRGASGKMVGPVREAFKQGGDLAAKAWSANAASTSGVHGKWYPSSIDAEAKFTGGGNIEVEVGPNSGKKQGSMGRGFEFGSMNQPPHLDGVKAFDATAPAIEQIAAAAVKAAIP